ncbi:hypothetical protein GCM10010914_28090 [Deinococcus wulumuqiensis]|uniref:ABC transporter ATP-binding protein n=1 Tax=Deinococcus wulumuqiensis TaxID=980427 RepID=A0AAV4KAD4_9DEIO|nr:hypothetical protein GCM10010914_28090 [Deinococcus wulumuqiensis]GGP31018.1 hypothetical protein GCM10008021_26690 [Deinococcus wulumuqiensis]
MKPWRWWACPNWNSASPRNCRAGNATRSPLLLLDEPLSNLDEKLRTELRHDLRGLFGQLGAGVLLVTHDQREALALAHRVAVMRAGQVVQVGAARNVFASPATAWTAEFLGWTNVFARPGGRALLVPEQAARLGAGDPTPLLSRQPHETGETVTLAHPLGPLTLHLSVREAALLGGAQPGDPVRLALEQSLLQEVPDDRQDR